MAPEQKPTTIYEFIAPGFAGFVFTSDSKREITLGSTVLQGQRGENKMQTLIIRISLVLTLFVWCPYLRATPIHLLAGQSFAYEFQTLPYEQGPLPNQPNAGAGIVEFGPDLFDPGEVVLFELFENGLADVPFESWLASNDSLFPAVAMAAAELDVWQDLQGVLRLTVVQGSVDISQLQFTVTWDGIIYHAFVTSFPQSVPDSGSNGFLLGIATLGLAGARWGFYARRTPDYHSRADNQYCTSR